MNRVSGMTGPAFSSFLRLAILAFAALRNSGVTFNSELVILTGELIVLRAARFSRSPETGRLPSSLNQPRLIPLLSMEIGRLK